MNVTVVNLLNKNTDVILNLNGTTKKLSTVTTETVDAAGNVGRYSSIAIDSNDNVHISYYNTTGGDLRYCNNTLGSWTCTNVETAGDVGKYSSIAIDSNNNVHLSHQNTTGGDLRYCNNTLGTWTCTKVGTEVAEGLEALSIAIDSNNNVHLSHHNNLYETVRYCNNTLGTWTCTSADGGGLIGDYTSIAIDSNNKVHTSHQNRTDKTLRYCNNTLGTWTCTNVDTSTASVGYYTSIAIDSNNKIHISHEDSTNYNLRYCNNTAGTWTCTNVETGGDVGKYSSIAIDSNNKPHISHYNGTDNTSRYCYTNDFSTWNCQKIDDTGGTIETYGRSIAIKKGILATSTSFSSSVHISYYNNTTDDLMHAQVVFQIEDASSWNTNFTITQGNNYILVVDYDNNQENITIGTKVNKSVYVGFFDVTLTGSETTYKDKFQKNYTLPAEAVMPTTTTTISTTTSTTTIVGGPFQP
jgi:hypothetical protein